MNRLKKVAASILIAVAISNTLPIPASFMNPVEYASAAVIRLNKTKVSMYMDETMDLKVTGTSKTAKWSSSDKTVATVSTDGTVTGIKKGTAIITAKIGTKKYTCTVSVLKMELTAQQVYELCSKATVELTSKVSDSNYNLGSGFFIDDGIIVTNFHVIDGASSIEVLVNSGSTYTVDQVLGYDEKMDIAVLKVNGTNESLVINQEGVTVGEPIYVLGSPLGLTGSFTGGMVSAATRVMDNIDYIQVSAPMSQGNSGGPLLNAFGQVMGINTWQYTNAQNMNFSINISELNKVSTANPITVSEFYKLTSDYYVASSSNVTTENLELSVIEQWYETIFTEELSFNEDSYALHKALWYWRNVANME